MLSLEAATRLQPSQGHASEQDCPTEPGLVSSRKSPPPAFCVGREVPVRGCWVPCRNISCWPSSLCQVGGLNRALHPGWASGTRRGPGLRQPPSPRAPGLEGGVPLAVSWGRRRLHSWSRSLAGCPVLVKLPASELTPGRKVHSEHLSCGGWAGKRLPMAQLTGAIPKYE